jgi:hypothetical protein
MGRTLWSESSGDAVAAALYKRESAQARCSAVEFDTIENPRSLLAAGRQAGGPSLSTAFELKREFAFKVCHVAHENAAQGFGKHCYRRCLRKGNSFSRTAAFIHKLHTIRVQTPDFAARRLHALFEKVTGRAQNAPRLCRRIEPR